MRDRDTFLGLHGKKKKKTRDIRHMMGKAEVTWQSWSKEKWVEGTTGSY